MARFGGPGAEVAPSSLAPAQEVFLFLQSSQKCFCVKQLYGRGTLPSAEVFPGLALC